MRGVEGYIAQDRIWDCEVWDGFKVGICVIDNYVIANLFMLRQFCAFWAENKTALFGTGI